MLQWPEMAQGTLTRSHRGLSNIDKMSVRFPPMGCGGCRMWK